MAHRAFAIVVPIERAAQERGHAERVEVAARDADERRGLCPLAQSDIGLIAVAAGGEDAGKEVAALFDGLERRIRKDLQQAARAI